MDESKDSVEEFARQTVTCMFHIMRNLKQSGVDAMPDVELSYPQILVLYALLESGPATMSELSNWLKISHGVATRTVDRLVEKGLVGREPRRCRPQGRTRRPYRRGQGLHGADDRHPPGEGGAVIPRGEQGGQAGVPPASREDRRPARGIEDLSGAARLSVAAARKGN